VLAGQVELRVGEVPGLEHAKVLGTESRELVRAENRASASHSAPGDGIDHTARSAVGPLRENDAGARHPIVSSPSIR